MSKKLVLVASLVVGAALVLAWLVLSGGRHAAGLLSTTLWPHAELHYAHARLTLDGGLLLDRPRLSAPGGSGVSVAARSLRLRASTPLAGLRWLIDPTLQPAALQARIDDLDSSALAAYAPLGSLHGSGLVPFETVACDESAGLLRNASDPADAGTDPARNTLRLDWKRGPGEGGGMDILLRHDHSRFGRINFAAELFEFSHGRARGVGITRLQLDHDDHGYLSQRNAICAQAGNIGTGHWIAAHVTALAALLAEADIRLSDETLELYRAHVTQGGQLRLSMLPDEQIEWQHWSIYSRAQLFRLLNITLRHDDGPPIMLGVEFTEPQRIPATVLDELDARAARAGNTVPPIPPVAVSHAAEPGLAHPPDPDADGAHMTAPTAPNPVVPAPEKRAVPTGRYAGERRLPPSTAPPEPGSDAALVWNPAVVERLPLNVPVVQEQHIVVDALHLHIGSRVRLVTDSRRHIEGRLISASADEVVLHLARPSGHAQLRIPTNSVAGAQLLRASATMGDGETSM